jgi:hypothetical protein
MLTECQNLVDNKMSELCGSTTECNVFASDELMGTGSLRSQKAPNGNYLISGLIQFGMIPIQAKNDDITGNASGGERSANWFRVDTQKYINGIPTRGDLAGVNLSEIKPTIVAELQNIEGQINRVMGMIATDPKISMCINGRDMSQIKKGGGQTQARFPNLLQSASAQIANSALQRANQNFNKAVLEKISEAMASASIDAANALCIDIVEGNLGGGDKGALDGVALSTIALEIPALKSKSGINVKPMSEKKDLESWSQGSGDCWSNGGVSGCLGKFFGGGVLGSFASGNFGDAFTGKVSWSFSGTVQSRFNRDTRMCTVEVRAEECKHTSAGLFTSKRKSCTPKNSDTEVQM